MKVPCSRYYIVIIAILAAISALLFFSGTTSLENKSVILTIESDEWSDAPFFKLGQAYTIIINSTVEDFTLNIYAVANEGNLSYGDFSIYLQSNGYNGIINETNVGEWSLKVHDSITIQVVITPNTGSLDLAGVEFSINGVNA